VFEIFVFRYVISWQYVLARICLIVDVSLRFMLCYVGKEMKCDEKSRV
jgi:hypothetical protein